MTCYTAFSTFYTSTQAYVATNLIVANTTSIIFQVMSCKDAMIGFMQNYLVTTSNMYEIDIGGSGNTFVGLR